MDRLYARPLRALRRRARFSLTTLLILVAIAAVFFAKVGNRVRAVQGAIHLIVKARGEITVDSPDDWWHRFGIGAYSDRIYLVSFANRQRDRSGTLVHLPICPDVWRIDDDFPRDLQLFHMREWALETSSEASDADDKVLRRLAAVGPDVLMLDLSSPLVTDAGVAALTKFRSLRVVFLNGSGVTDQGVLELAKLKDLRFVELRHTAVTDACLETLLKVPKLRSLDVEETKVTPEGLRKIETALAGRSS